MDYANYTDMTNKNSTFFKTAKDEPFEIVKEFTNSDQKKLKLNASFKKKQDEYKKSGKITDYINMVLKNIGRTKTNGTRLGNYESRKAINQCWDGSDANKAGIKETGADCNIAGTVCDGTFGQGTCVAKRKYGQLCDTTKDNFCETNNCLFYAETLQQNACRYKVNSRQKGETCGKHEECEGEMSCCGPQNKKDIGQGICHYGVKDMVDMKYCPDECQGREGFKIPGTCSLKDVDKLGYDGTCAFDVQCEDGKVCINNKCKHLLDNYERTYIAQAVCTPKEAVEYAYVFNHDDFKDMNSGVTNYSKIIELEKKQNREGGGYRCKSGYSCHGICFPNPFKDTYKLNVQDGKVNVGNKYVTPKTQVVDTSGGNERKGAKYEIGEYCWKGEPHCRIGLDCYKYVNKVQDAKDTVDTMGKLGFLGRGNQGGPQDEKVLEAAQDVREDVDNAWKDWTCEVPPRPEQIGDKCEKGLFDPDPCKEGVCIHGECKCTNQWHCQGKSERSYIKEGKPVGPLRYYCSDAFAELSPNACWEKYKDGESSIKDGGCHYDDSCLSGKSFEGKCIADCETFGEKVYKGVTAAKDEINSSENYVRENTKKVATGTTNAPKNAGKKKGAEAVSYKHLTLPPKD